MEEDNSWIFDSLICFLNGPIWNAPLQSFIEEKSLIFEPNVSEDGEYRTIYEEFKNLVDFMLGSFMEDIGISPEQFEDACHKGSYYSISFDHGLFEQIWAANDYEMFKRMMTQRNVELQLQALELIEQKYGITPQSFIPKKNEAGTSSTIDIPIEKDVMTEVAKNFPKETKEEEVQYILEEKELLEKQLKQTKVPVKQETKVEINKAELPKTNSTERDQKPIINTEINSVDFKKRQEYLRAQRDKLVALKKDVRKKKFDDENESKEKAKSRPKSAKAAQAVLAGEKVDSSQLQIRKALAARLKTEVVAKKH